MRPKREPARNNQQTYFVTFQTADRTPLFRNDRWAQFFLNVLSHYRSEYLLHNFVIMPDHIHLLITPAEALERSIQLLKGGFSFKAKRDLGWNGPVWQTSFTDHRVRDAADLEQHHRYIEKNAATISRLEYRFVGAASGLPLDEVPQRLKPHSAESSNGGAEAPPLQRNLNQAPAHSEEDAVRA